MQHSTSLWFFVLSSQIVLVAPNWLVIYERNILRLLIIYWTWWLIRFPHTHSFIWYCARWWGWRVCYTDRKCCPHGTYIKLKIVIKMGIWGTRSGLWLWHFLRCERRIMTYEKRAQFWMCSIWLCQSNTQNDFVKLYISSVQFSHSVVSNSLWPHELQHTRPPCPSPAPSVYPNPCPSSRWCHLTILSSLVPFSSWIFPSIRVFSNESAFPIRWPKY